ncbi:hypothetical protein QTP86_017747 [Hemibagrus guttatus]|nr:hypothetical protein QTP86_017747 [Hemibagrus guttatus]
MDMAIINTYMESTFSLRRKEIVNEQPLVSVIKERWPCLFLKEQVCAEFRRITGVDLKIAFMSSLNKHSNNLIKIYRAKTKDLADEMKLILDSFDEQDTDEEEAYVRGVKLCILEVMEDDISTSEKPTCVNRGIIVEGTLVMEDIPDFPTAFMVLFGLLYALKISYPKGLKYTFEAVQDIFVGLGEKCTNKVQSLKNKLFKV